MKEREIAVRLFTNDKYGKTYGPGLYNKAVFNAAAELRNPYTKYLLDYLPFNDWANTAKTDEQMSIYREMAADPNSNDPDCLYSWIQHYDPTTKRKLHVYGVSVLNLKLNNLGLCISDSANNVDESWTLPVATCKATGAHKPQLLAANIDVGNW